MFFLYLQNMNKVLTILVFNSLFINGLFLACNYEITKSFNPKSTLSVDPDTKMIGWHLKFNAYKYLPELLFKPLIGCVTCMASIHSVYFYWAFMPFTIHNTIIYMAYIPALAALNTVINKFTNA